MRLRTVFLICLAGLPLVQSLALADTCLVPAENRPKIALVLGGGGARGVAHIGIIKALEELRIPVDYIAGTSMGALIGGMYATGMSADEIETVATSIDWSDTFRDNIPRKERPFRRKRDDRLGLYGAKIGLGKDSSVLPRAAIAGQKVDFLLESIVGYRTRSDDFDELPIPFRAIAVDILAGEIVVMDRGNLSVAMRSSMSLPAVFDPVEDRGRLLVDGGVLMNLPVSVGKEMGADVVIAVDVGSPLAPEEEVRNIVQILYQLTGVVTVVNTRQQIELLGPDDFLLTPLVESEIGTGNFAESASVIPNGYEAAMANRERLSRFSMSDTEWEWRQARIKMCVDGPPVVDFVRIDNRSRLSDEMIRSRIGLQPGDTLDLDVLEKEIQAIYALGFLQSVQFNLVEEAGQTGLELEVIDDARGTRLFEYGIGLRSSSRVSDFVLRTGILKTDVGQRGGEFRGLLQFGQELGGMAELWLPLGDDLRYTFLPRLIAEQSRFDEFDDDGNRIRQFEINQYLLDLEIGRAFGNTALLSAGIRVGRGNVDVAIGDPDLVPLDFDRGEYFLRGAYDSLDNRFFPGSGNSTNFVLSRSDQSLGASLDFEQFSISSLGAWTVGRHSFIARIEYGVSFDDVIPFSNQYRGGGFPRLSGFQYNELLGENLGIVMSGYRYKLLENSLFPGWLGGTIEYGNVADQQSELFSNGVLNGSLYLGIDSIIGPMYLGIGAAEGGRRTFFLSIGSIFTGDSLSDL